VDARSRARLGAFAQHAAYDTRETTRAAREAFARRFERQVDPDGVLPAPERARRAEAAKRAYFQRMALRSAKARRKKAARQMRSPGASRRCASRARTSAVEAA
jgi:hypothetical protein